MIEVSTDAIDAGKLKAELLHPGAGGFCSFEGWVRNENDGRSVRRLEYEAYEPLVIAEGK
ncbi:MAG: molybdenum cofactor biosynthesis protein MoaE, partial [Gammaproteobacteria bacterium]|nr:molybdenum cofactor biosynthesis protein MoaE [Gammaproteobacteria bacterium]